MVLTQQNIPDMLMDEGWQRFHTTMVLTQR